MIAIRPRRLVRAGRGPDGGDPRAAGPGPAERFEAGNLERLAPSAEPVPFTALQEHFAREDRPGSPMTIGVTVELDGRIDVGILGAAMADAAPRHPAILSRRAPSRAWHPWPAWVASERATPSIRVVDNAAGVPAERYWPALLAQPLRLDDPPLVRVLIVRGEVDSLLVIGHMAATDPVALLSVVQDVAGSYRRLAAHGDDVVVLGTTDRGSCGLLPELGLGPDGAAERWCRKAGTVRELVGPRSARIAAHQPVRPSTWVEISGHGVTHRRCDRTLSANLVTAADLLGAPLDALLAAALHVTIDRWNDGRRQPAARISVSVPTADLRVERRTESTAQHRDDPAGAVALITAQLRFGGASRHPFAGDRRSAARAVPEPLRRVVPAALAALTGDRSLATSRLVVVGEVPSPSLDFGAVGCAQLSLTLPVRMPQGLTIAVTDLGGRLTLGLRWCDALFSAESAGAFTDLYVATLRSIVARAGAPTGERT